MKEYIEKLNLDGVKHKNLDWNKVYTEECNGVKIYKLVH